MGDEAGRRNKGERAKRTGLLRVSDLTGSDIAEEGVFVGDERGLEGVLDAGEVGHAGFFVGGGSGTGEFVGGEGGGREGGGHFCV